MTVMTTCTSTSFGLYRGLLLGMKRGGGGQTTISVCDDQLFCIYFSFVKSDDFFCLLKFLLLLEVELRDRIGRFLDFFLVISDPRFLSVRSGIGRFFCVCTIHEKYK